MPKVSVIVPVYNVEQFLPRCLESLTAQTLKDYEVIVVNDGSPDNSQRIIDKFAKEFPDIIKPFIKKNGGLSDARNFGIKKAKGEYIGFVDSDDFVTPQMFEQMYNKAIESASDVVVCGHNSVYLGKRGDIKNLIPHPVFAPHIFGQSIYDCPEILTCVRSYAWNKIYKREILQNFEFPEGQLFEDSAIVYNILSQAEKISVLEECHYQYLCGRQGAITTTVNNNIFDIFKSCNSIIQHFKKIGKFDVLKPEIESICLMHIHARYLTLNKAGSLKIKYAFTDHSFKYLNEKFPQWQNNKYYLARRAAPLTTHPAHKFELARENRLVLKFHFTNKCVCGVIQKGLSPFYKNLRKVAKRFKKKIHKSKPPKTVPTQNLTTEELCELQQTILNVFKVFKNFCDSNSLRYYLFEGSLLGAVRHGGFIPWDDDLDVAMPRKDYEKFVKLWSTNQIGDCILSHQTTNKGYYLTFAKILYVKDCKFKSLLHKDLKHQTLSNDIGIDVFPLDNCEPLSIKLFHRARKMRKLRNILLAKVNYFKNPKKRRFYSLYKNTASFKTLHKMLHKLYTKNSDNCNYIANFASSYILTKEHFPKDYFEPARKITFEGIQATIPLKAEEILKCIYGNYTILPPEEKRITPHKYIVDK